MVSNDANLAEIIAIMKAISWINRKEWDDYIFLSDSLIAVTNINREADFKDRYTNATNACSVVIAGRSNGGGAQS